MLQQRDACLMLARLTSFRDRADRALRLIDTALSQMKQPYVASSMGKDSDVVLDLVRRVNPDVTAIMGYDDWLLPETEEKRRATQSLIPVAATIWHSEFYTSWPNGKPEKLPDSVLWFDAVRNSRVAPYALSQGFDGAFIGLRKQEASYRRFHLNSRGGLFFCKTHSMLECNPIADWKVEDVWAYLLSRDIAYNRAYDKMCEMNIPLSAQRIGPMSAEAVSGYGQMAILKRGWPESFNSFAASHPEARSYV